jgi:hypothetical protein
VGREGSVAEVPARRVDDGGSAADRELQRAATDAYARLVALQGDNPDAWNWGDLHAITLTSDTFGYLGLPRHVEAVVGPPGRPRFVEQRVDDEEQPRLIRQRRRVVPAGEQVLRCRATTPTRGTGATCTPSR